MSGKRLAETLVSLAVATTATTGHAAIVDFESAAVGAAPSGWTVAMTHEGGPPRWEIVRDDSSRGPQVLAQLSNDRTSQRFPLAILTNETVRDGAVSVRFNAISGRVDQAAGLVWRYRDANNYYVVRANALEDNVVLYKVEGGERVALSPVGREGDYGQRQDVPAGEWHTLSVEFRGTRFSVSFDGRELYEVEDATFTTAGQVGLWTKADSVTHFDDFDVASDQQ